MPATHHRHWNDSVVEAHGYATQGSNYGQSGVRGLNALLATASTAGTVIMRQQLSLRRGSVSSPSQIAR